MGNEQVANTVKKQPNNTTLSKNEMIINREEYFRSLTCKLQKNSTNRTRSNYNIRREDAIEYFSSLNELNYSQFKIRRSKLNKKIKILKNLNFSLTQNLISELYVHNNKELLKLNLFMSIPISESKEEDDSLCDNSLMSCLEYIKLSDFKEYTDQNEYKELDKIGANIIPDYKIESLEENQFEGTHHNSNEESETKNEIVCNKFDSHSLKTTTVTNFEIFNQDLIKLKDPFNKHFFEHLPLDIKIDIKQYLILNDNVKSKIRIKDTSDEKSIIKVKSMKCPRHFISKETN